MSNKIRKIDTDKDISPAHARADYGPATVGVEWDNRPDVKTAVFAPSSGERQHVLNREMHEVVVYQDDFLGDVVRDQYTLLSGSDAQALDPVISAAKNGMIRLTCGNDATTTMAVNGSQLSMALNWDSSVSNGRLFMETRIKVSAITNIVLFVGFTDTLSLEMPFTMSGTTLTSNATDGLGLMFDTGQTTDRFYAVGVDSDTDATEELLDTAPVAATWIRLGVALWDDGVGQFFINGVQKGADMAAACTPTVDLTPTLAVFSETTTAHTLDADYLRCEMARV